jgi:thioesterase domain-containing protein
LAALIAEGGGVAAPSILVPLQPYGRSLPFVCVHPIGGDVVSYAHLATALGPDRPVLAVQSSQNAQLKTVEEIAELYILELLRAIPQARCLLGGWSFGGLVAFEMARQLNARGCHAPPVVLLDTHPPAVDRRADSISDSDFLGRIAAEVAFMLGRNPAAAQDSFLALPVQARWEFLRKELRDAEIFGSQSERELDRLLDTLTRHAEAADRYGPYRVAQQIELFAASAGTGPETLADRWSRWTTAEIRVHVVYGDHYSMLRPPGVYGLAARLERCFVSAERGQPREVASWTTL